MRQQAFHSKAQPDFCIYIFHFKEDFNIDFKSNLWSSKPFLPTFLKLCWLEYQICTFFYWKGKTIFITFFPSTCATFKLYHIQSATIISILFHTWIGILPLNKRVEGKKGSDHHKIIELLIFWPYYTDFEERRTGRTKKCLTSPHFWVLGSFSPSPVIYLYFSQWVPCCPPGSSAFLALYPPHASADHD